MNVLLINGSPNKKGCTFTALSEIAKELEKEGIQCSFFHVGKKPIRGCTACWKCEEKRYCVFEDDKVNECIDLIKAADGVIIGTPVYYASPNGALLALLDRVFFASGEKFAYKIGASIVNCRRSGSATAFDVLNKYFTISNMPIVSSQYWNGTHGSEPEEVMQNLEGLQVMRVLGKNMAWLLKCLDYAKGKIPLPEREAKRYWTNFIR